MKKIGLGIGGYLLGVVFLSSVLSGPLTILLEAMMEDPYPLKRVFNRVLMISALILIFPLARYWEIKKEEIGLSGIWGKSDQFSWGKIIGEWGKWFLIGGGMVIGLYLCYAASGYLLLGKEVEKPWKFLEYAASGIAVGFFEEILFRGCFFLALLKMVKKENSVYLCVGTSLFFAVTHFLKAESLAGETVWHSGFWIWQGMFKSALDFQFVVMKAGSLFLVGLVLCALVYRQKHLWGAMGLHAGWIFVQKSGKLLTEETDLPMSLWFHEDIVIGLTADVFLIGLLILILKRK